MDRLSTKEIISMMILFTLGTSVLRDIIFIQQKIQFTF